ncbi:hypothetical protein [Sutterella sp.]|uniref:hypothetical protein n=1 Tax=Sutterella sp. TaxID=1981025 RepID=UPI0026DEA470|nr:hypothetical protein [Sutterella sp.]MDO5531866.1 hypothetical protein [Sutterella sp.]
MQRRQFLRSAALCALAPVALGVRGALAAPAPNLAFDEMYAGVSVLGLKFSEKLKSLDQKPVTILGFMAPPLKADAHFLVLTREPVSLCPFCNTDEDWPDSIIVVYLDEKQEFVQSNRLIAVSGTLELGSRTDEETGFVSLVRIVAARFEPV